MGRLTIRQFRQKILDLQTELAEQPQVDLPVLHDFSKGVYCRQILMKKGTLVIGKTHKTEHLNIVMSGSASVLIDGEVKFIKAPYVFNSGKGIKKVLYIHEEMIWATIHLTDETDLNNLEKLMVYTEKEERELIRIKKCQIYKENP